MEAMQERHAGHSIQYRVSSDQTLRTLQDLARYITKQYFLIGVYCRKVELPKEAGQLNDCNRL
jgi:hypothetical protein